MLPDSIKEKIVLNEINDAFCTFKVLCKLFGQILFAFCLNSLLCIQPLVNDERRTKQLREYIKV